MPLSEHEQQMLDQIERALYAEDPKFASTVRRARLRRPSRRRRIQGISLFVLGMGLLVVGLIVPIRVINIPVISVLGFVLWFFGAVMVWTTFRQRDLPDDAAPATGGKGKPGTRSKPGKAKGSVTQRMEERLRRRFEES